MLEQIPNVPGEVLDTDAYLDDFWPSFKKIADEFWKLERRQTFRETEDPGYEAFLDGDWCRALRLEEDTRDLVREHYRKVAAWGFEGRRLRVAESPVSPYLQWEMQSLRIRAAAGERTRVVDARDLRHLERDRPLPELVILGTRLMYEVLYDVTSVNCGARRIDDADIIARCRSDLAELWAKGEDLSSYFEREIAPLPPPPPQR